jgi:hypothetical protein
MPSSKQVKSVSRETKFEGCLKISVKSSKFSKKLNNYCTKNLFQKKNILLKKVIKAICKTFRY